MNNGVARLDAGSDDSAITKREVLAILFARWGTILTVFIGILAVSAFLVFYFISPAYESEATIVISGNGLSTPLLEALPVTDLEKITAFQTQKDVLESTNLAARVVDRLDLARTMQLSHYQQLGLLLRAWKRELGQRLGFASWTKPENRRALAMKLLLGELVITTKPESQAIKVTYRAGDPKEAEQTLSALIDEFAEYYNRGIHERAAGAAALLQEQLGDMQQRLRQAEELLFQFKQSDNLQLDAVKPSAKGRPASKLPSGELSITGLTDSATVQNELKVAILGMEEELRKMRIDYPDDRAEVIELKQRIANYVTVLNELPKRELELFRLKREMDARQDALLTLERSYERAQFVARGTIAKADLISVLETPVAPSDSISPKPRLTMALAAVFGALFAMIWAMCLHYMDPALTSPRDVHRYLGLSVIGSMPAI